MSILRESPARRIVPISAIRKSRSEVAVIIQWVAQLARDSPHHAVSAEFIEDLAYQIATGKKQLPAHLVSDEGEKRGG